MKIFIKTLFTLLVLCRSGQAQSFVNLDFESANIVPDPNGSLYPYNIAITNALPGWSAFGTTQGDITYNAPALGSSWISLWATNGQQISGKYSVLLQGGLGTGGYISQTGLVPASAASILFEAQSIVGADAGSLVVSLGGQNLSIFAIGTGPNYTLYGADISAYAGQNEQLEFTALTGSRNDWTLDNIQFSSSPVPEPSELVLAALGGLLIGFRRRQIFPKIFKDQIVSRSRDWP